MSYIFSIRHNINLNNMTYKFKQFANEIIDPIIEIKSDIRLNTVSLTYFVDVYFPLTEQAVYFELPFTGVENIETQVMDELKRYER